MLNFSLTKNLLTEFMTYSEVVLKKNHSYADFEQILDYGYYHGVVGFED